MFPSIRVLILVIILFYNANITRHIFYFKFLIPLLRGDFRKFKAFQRSFKSSRYINIFLISFCSLSESPRNDLGPISVSVREATPTISPGNPGPGLLTTASATAPTPPAEPTTAATSPPGHHPHFQGLYYQETY